ncbi:MAG: hypothetical protein IID44_12285 [Planctomycetes bacterium]|nr:hypothetical protein [Planctomycetota bacterium]
MKTICLAFLFVGLLAPQLHAQKDAPVTQTYLPRIEIYHDKDAAITVDLLFKSMGGPEEQNERQCYILAFLKRDEQQILKIASDPKLLKKQKNGFSRSGLKRESGDKELFLDVLLEKKLVVPLESKAVKREASSRIGGRGKGSVAERSFPYKFTFQNKALFAAMQKLGNFDKDHAMVFSNQPTQFLNRLKLLVFIPLNDCRYANKVSPKLRRRYDFNNIGDPDMLLLYLRPLPYEFEFLQRKDDKVFVHIN